MQATCARGADHWRAPVQIGTACIQPFRWASTSPRRTRDDRRYHRHEPYLLRACVSLLGRRVTDPTTCEIDWRVRVVCPAAEAIGLARSCPRDRRRGLYLAPADATCTAWQRIVDAFLQSGSTLPHRSTHVVPRPCDPLRRDQSFRQLPITSFRPRIDRALSRYSDAGGRAGTSVPVPNRMRAHEFRRARAAGFSSSSYGHASGAACVSLRQRPCTNSSRSFG